MVASAASGLSPGLKKCGTLGKQAGCPLGALIQTSLLLNRGLGEQLDARRLLAARPRGDLELHPLALIQTLEALALDRREVDEDVASGVALDKPVAFSVVKPLDCSLQPEFLLINFIAVVIIAFLGP
jgi:hypothetical protein